MNCYVVITNQADNDLSVFSDKTLYCYESVCDILKHSLHMRYDIGEKFFVRFSEIPECDKNTPIVTISCDCFDIPAEVTDSIIEEYKTGKNLKIYDRENKKVIAKITTGAKCEAVEYKSYTADYMPTQSFGELRKKNQTAQLEITERHEKSGVQFVSIDGVGISPFAEISPGAVIYQGTIIRGKSKIGANTVLGPNTLIDSSTIGENCVINSTQIYSSTIEDEVRIGPYCHIRPNCVIKRGVKIGDFVEIKNSNIGENTHASHLTYIGDSDVGKDVNFGCGTVTVNYDGVKKARCNIGDRAFIGCNTNLVAPINIGDDAFTAAGSTLTKDVPAGSLAVSRAREQNIIESWVARHRGKKQ